ncbi:MAG: ribonuclease D [Gammaproteobacteria bacterium]|jgi:ribonuclease D|nr:ribonuclease D [Gammaproteobacteria bacterium]
MTSSKYLFVDTTDALAQACDLLSGQKLLCADTEFMRVRTYFPQLALLQFATDKQVLCIDPTAAIDLSPLWSVLLDPARTKIFHSGKQDYEAFYCTLNDVPKNLFDTQVAAALCGHPAQIGYAGLIEARFGISISKSQTRSDWLQRPLTGAQLNYAAEDVEHLEELYSIFCAELIALGRLEWAIEDSAALTNIELYRPDPNTAWQRLKNLQYAAPAEQARARVLAAWREQRAVDLDKPRSWILNDSVIRTIATVNPKNKNELATVPDLPPATLRKSGEKLLQLVKEANKKYQNGDITTVQQNRPDAAHKALLKQLSKIVLQKAESLNIPAEILASKKELNAIILGDMKQRTLSGWRANEIGQQLLAEL